MGGKSLKAATSDCWTASDVPPIREFTLRELGTRTEKYQKNPHFKGFGAQAPVCFCCQVISEKSNQGTERGKDPATFFPYW